MEEALCNEITEKTLLYQVTPEDASAFDGGRVDLLLRHRMGLSRREISHAKFTPDGVMLGRKEAESGKLMFRRVNVKERAVCGSILKVILTAPDQGKVLPSPGALDILYEDEDIIALNKPAGIVSHPAHGHFRDTMANRLAARLNCAEAQTIRLIGRLDQDTSGVLLFAKTKAAALRLSRQRQAGELQKHYLALAKINQLDPRYYALDRVLAIDLPIGAVPGELMKQRITEPPLGKRAVTRYRILSAENGIALLMATPETGRTHQIRVHFAAIGAPLIGDSLYGGERHREGIGRAMLHAWKLKLLLPFSEKPLEITAPLPDDFTFYSKRTKQLRFELAQTGNYSVSDDIQNEFI